MNGARPPTAEDSLQRAAMAIQANRPIEAERLAADVLRRNAGDLRAMQVLGHALLAQNRGAEAVKPLERVAKQTRNPLIETQLALALKQAGRDDEALARLERATTRQPPFPPAFLELGNLLTALGRHNDAIETLKRGLLIAPDFTDLWLLLGNVHAAQGDAINAAEAFGRAVAATPRNTDAIFALARAKQSLRKYQEAADLFQRILAITPNDAASQIGLGISLMELGQAQAGLERLRIASQSSEKMFGQALAALVSCGHGRFWIRRADAERALRQTS